MRKLRYVAGTLLGVLLAMLLLSPFSTSAAHAQVKATSHPLTTPVSGTISNGDTFSGIFTVKRFVAHNNKLFAVGTVSGIVKTASGSAIRNEAAIPVVNVPAALPVTGAAPALVCNVLNLNLGPLDLNLLGLVVHLNQVVLNITAQPGALLGNLLCSLAGLLNGGTPLAGLVGLLNQILAAL